MDVAVVAGNEQFDVVFEAREIRHQTLHRGRFLDAFDPRDVVGQQAGREILLPVLLAHGLVFAPGGDVGHEIEIACGRLLPQDETADAAKHPGLAVGRQDLPGTDRATGGNPGHQGVLEVLQQRLVTGWLGREGLAQRSRKADIDLMHGAVRHRDQTEVGHGEGPLAHLRDLRSHVGPWYDLL